MSAARTPGPWFWNPYRSTISQQDPTRPFDYKKELVAIVYQSRHTPLKDEDMQLAAAAPELLEAVSLGHSDSHGFPCGDLLAAANVLRNAGNHELAERLERKHEAERIAIAKAKGEAK